MKRINENQKVTLTLKQLKKLVKESTEDDYPYAGKNYTGDNYGVHQIGSVEDLTGKYDRVFVLINEDWLVAFGANSFEDFVEISDKSGWFGKGFEDIMKAVWDLEVNGVYDDVPRNFVEDFAWIRIS